ncbi:hypothetical protein [Polaribacter sp. R77954]|uniref:hypothetical protein n=1 Tax=Polaribacter sp. R77954 TaxID=3093870 RepID=UPI0037C64E36
MKKTVFLIFILIVSESFIQKTELKFNLIGSWKTEGFFKYGKFTFDKDGFVLIDYNDDPIGGKKFSRNGKFYSLKYKLELKSEPKQLDLIFTNLESGNEMTWRGIIQVLNDNKIRYARAGNNESRPENFENIESIILERMK